LLFVWKNTTAHQRAKVTSSGPASVIFLTGSVTVLMAAWLTNSSTTSLLDPLVVEANSSSRANTPSGNRT
jgi:hypothetical protein